MAELVTPRGRTPRRALAVAAVLAVVAGVAPAEAGVRVLEKRANLDISLRVASGLRAAGIKVILTRTTDRTMRREQRYGPANRLHVDAFVSIHNNASRNPRVAGSEIYRSIRKDGSYQLGRAIWRGFRAEFGSRRRNVLRTRRGDHGDYYYQLRKTTMPAVLVEGAYVSNPAEGRRLGASPAYRARIADAIVDGILRWQRGLVRARAPRPDPGTVVPAPLPPPVNLRARALGGTRVLLGWDPSPLVQAYRIYRNGRLIAVRAPTAGLPTPPRRYFTDIWGAPGQTYTYEVRAVQALPGGVYGESVEATVTAKTKPITIAIDPGHGGRDPGAVARYA